METDLQKVLKQKIPYHAHVYPKYNLLLEIDPAKRMRQFFKEEVGMEIDDDDNNDGRPLAKIKRACIISGTEEQEDRELDVLSHGALCTFMDSVEERIHINGWGVKNFKIFHIWNIKVNEKSGIFPWSAKFQPLKNELEVEIHSEKGNENDTNKVKVVDLIIDPEDCDRISTVTVDDCELNYSVFSDAWRLELEIRLYEVDGSPALNFSGGIHAYFLFGEDESRITLFDGECKNEESEVVIRSSLILPRHIWAFDIDMSLRGNIDKFMSILRVTMIPRSVPIDEQHYILSQDGYVLLTTKRGCCCVDKGLCVCPGSPACRIETFAEKYPSSEEESEEDSKDGIDENKTKRAKMEEDPPVSGAL